MQDKQILAEAGKPSVYAEDQQPCVVAKKPCGCYQAAYGLDGGDLIAMAKWSGKESTRPPFIDFLKEYELDSVEFEIRPVSFVREGRLTFVCMHKTGKSR